jgi:hypothetical protein
VAVLYFPSRFDLPRDRTCMDLLRAFGSNTSKRTSVNFWEPRDDYFEKALELFDLSSPPALVLTNGTGVTRSAVLEPEDVGLYSIMFTRPEIFDDHDRFVTAVNLAQQVLMKGNPQEIAGLIRRQNLSGVLLTLGRVAAEVRDQLVSLKPTLGLPGGVSLRLG